MIVTVCGGGMLYEMVVAIGFGWHGGLFVCEDAYPFVIFLFV
jgi:hypothetical protein